MVSTHPLVEARDLTKVYPARGSTPEFRAVDGIDFALERGESFGLLGPNGAGKSTTMRMIAATSPISGGSLRVLGMDPMKQGPEIRARLGVVTQDDHLDNELTVRENLHIYGRYFGLPRAVIRERATRLLDFAQLQEKAGDQVETLSGGMRRRLTIARSLINEPDILLLDEPTTGLDPQARHILWDRLFQLKQQGVTLILTTHYMDEAEQLCDRLVVVDHGRIVAQGSPQELIHRYATREVLELRFRLDERDTAAEKLRTSVLATGGTDAEGRVELLPDRVLVYTADGEAALATVHAMSLTPLTALVRRATLEDVFLKLTGRSLIE
ncbi:ABC transporter ATP-binding protein [Micromonospora foliorum]|uniref:ABC transporter ATP-binding protein n=1 Tax=Micromonospora foliorum TaxID=2911210 RepID=UPI001EE93430|nr:ABC transporter ATP-binding protein [Micromonospora foliorum]MCG5435846.1 ABC transporter ATP-binding protein [Micromonospora foliorum]